MENVKNSIKAGGARERVQAVKESSPLEQG